MTLKNIKYQLRSRETNFGTPQEYGPVAFKMPHKPFGIFSPFELKDILFYGGPVIDLQPTLFQPHEIVHQLKFIESQLTMLYEDGLISQFFWELCLRGSQHCRAVMSVKSTQNLPESFELVKNHIRFINKNLFLVIKCERSLGSL